MISNKMLSCVLVITFLAFSPLLKADFINWDDGTHVYDNELVTNFSFESFLGIFSQTINDTYIPLTTLSFFFENQIFELNPLAFHFDNILLHLANVGLIFLLGSALGFNRPVSLVACLIFAIHPMHVESVAWVTERKDVLYSLFYIGSLLCYARYIKGREGWFYCAALLLAAFSILSKPMAVSLPLILLLIDWYLKRRNWKSLTIEKLPFAFVVTPIALITFILNQREIPFHFPEAVLIWIWSFIFYLRKFLVPQNFATIYPFNPSVLSIEFIGSAIMMLSLLIFLWMKRRDRLLVFAFLFYFLSIFFLLRFDNFDTHVVADRFMYLPSLGICFLISSAAFNILNYASQQSRWMLKTFGFVLICGLFVQTYSISKVWQNYHSFWDYTISKNPKCNDLPFIVRGEEYFEKGEYKRAADSLTIALEIKESPEAYFLRGKAYYYLKKFEEALNDFSRAHESEEDIEGWRGYMLLKLGRFESAIVELNASINKFGNAESYLNRGLAYEAMGEMVKAREDFNAAMRLSRDVDVYRQSLSQIQTLALGEQTQTSN